MSPLGLVTVAATTIVKAVSLVGMAVGAYYLAQANLAMMVVGFENPIVTKLLVSGAVFFGSLAGWHFADKIAGKAQVDVTKADQEKELARLEAHHGHAL